MSIPGSSMTPATSSGSGSGIRSMVAAVSKPLGGLIAVAIGICGFAVPSLHGLGVPFSSALIVAGLGSYGISVSKS